MDTMLGMVDLSIFGARDREKLCALFFDFNLDAQANEVCEILTNMEEGIFDNRLMKLFFDLEGKIRRHRSVSSETPIALEYEFTFILSLLAELILRLATHELFHSTLKPPKYT